MTETRPLRPGRSAGQPEASSIRAAKDALRVMIAGERKLRSERDRVAAERGVRDVFLELPHVQEGARVALYVSQPGEPGTQLLRATLAARGVSVLLPLITDRGVVRWLPDNMAASGDGSRRRSVRRRPAAPSGVAIGEVTVMLVPALAVDTCGRRLGRGREGYDRVLRSMSPSALVLGVVHDTELLDAAVEPVPEESHDVRVDAAMTPSRVFYLPRSCRVTTRVATA